MLTPAPPLSPLQIDSRRPCTPLSSIAHSNFCFCSSRLLHWLLFGPLLQPSSPSLVPGIHMDGGALSYSAQYLGFKRAVARYASFLWVGWLAENNHKSLFVRLSFRIHLSYLLDSFMQFFSIQNWRAVFSLFTLIIRLHSCLYCYYLSSPAPLSNKMTASLTS